MFKVNEYFGGNVKSIGFTTAEGAATVGVMAPGEYEFGTSTVEIMTVTCGALEIRMPGESVWKTFRAAESFTVAAGVKFGVRVAEASSYLCLYR
jgi:purine/pyrimidine-nucleoside phosphorylase